MLQVVIALKVIMERFATKFVQGVWTIHVTAMGGVTQQVHVSVTITGEVEAVKGSKVVIVVLAVMGGPVRTALYY